MPNYSAQEISHITAALLGTNRAAKLTLLSTQPISPPNGGVTAASYQGSMTKDFGKLKVTTGGYRIAYIDLKRCTADPAKVGALTFDAHFADQCPTGSRAGKVPIWWLPWESRHMTKLTIDPPAVGITDSSGAALPNPDIFFTAALSGCSVFVRAPANQPKIYHGGITGKLTDQKTSHGVVRGVFNKQQFARYGGTIPAFWRQVFDGMTYDPTNDPTLMQPRPVGSKFAGPAQIAEVNLMHYVSDRGTQTTVNSRHLEDFLKKQLKQKQKNLIGVSPWGSVFGLRDNGTQNWEFYMQQNVTVIYHPVGNPGNIMTESLLLSCTLFFPGQGQVNPPTLKNTDFSRISYALP